MNTEDRIDIHLLLATFRCFHEQLYNIKGKHSKVLKLKFNRLINIARAYENEILKLNNGEENLDIIYDELMDLIIQVKESVTNANAHETEV
mgnify:CR=1 FL=1|jgi:hypothetical protein|tara:strand:+ start:1009 stop:1281 length:273 start_codon:yes stop_codon:yes gene_type:complete